MATAEWLNEQLNTCENLIELARLAIDYDRKELILTALELLFEQCQMIIEDNCVEGNE